MKQIFTAIAIGLALQGDAQDDCTDRVLAKTGTWKKINSTNRASAVDFATQQKFTAAIHMVVQPYQPRGVQAEWYTTHGSREGSDPVASYAYRIVAMQYSCKGATLELNHETYTSFNVLFNPDFGRLLFQPAGEASETGFDALREGFPEELSPGVWKFKDVRTPLGFGIDGLSHLWLITYPGELPWIYVTRREFLQQRRTILLKLVKQEEDRLRQNVADLERQKKDIEKVLRNDPAKFAVWLKSDYEPAPARYRQAHDSNVKNLTSALDKVNQQSNASSEELDKRAIVIKSTQNHLDYTFSDSPSRDAEILVKPNRNYFRKTLAASVPQLIEARIIFNPSDVVSENFAGDISELVQPGYLQSLIGKSAPTTYNGPAAAKKEINEPATSKQNLKSPARKPETSTPAPVTQNGKETSSTRPGKTFVLGGTVSAPVGATVGLVANSGNNLSVTSPSQAGKIYNTSPVRFTRQWKIGEEYSIAIKNIPANMKAAVEPGKGRISAEGNTFRVGVDYRYELLTRRSDDKVMSTFYESFAPAVGGTGKEEGRYVVFISNTKNLAGSDGKFRQVFWRDRNTGITKLVSATAAGEQGNGDCAEPSISSDGQTVVFESRATNLVAGDNNNVKDIFLWNAATQSLKLVSRSSTGGAADAESFDASISGNGKFVVFTSPASNLSSTPKGRSLANIFIHDLNSGKTEMISVDPAQKTGGNGYKASINYDGARVSFCSPTNTLVPNDNNGLWDIFLWERGKAGLRRVSLTHDGQERNGGSESASRQVSSALSGDGRYVAFATTASNMVPGDNNNFQDVFVVEIETGKVVVASFADDEPSNGDSPIEQGERIAISYDGTWIAFPTKATNLGVPGSNIVLHNRVTGKKTAVSDVKGSYVGRPSISYHGSYVIFGKSANLDSRYSTSGVFAHFTANGPWRE